MRRLRVVAGMALIVILALVAVPGPVGSRAPSPVAAPDPALFHPVEVLSPTRGTTTTVQPPDPGARSAGNLDERSMIIEPSSRTESTAAPVRGAQPDPTAGVVVAAPVPGPQPTPPSVVPTRVGTNPVTSTGGWRSDGQVSWYGPGFYGHHTACGQTLTRGLVGVANKTLPCGTRIVFRNPANGRTLVVPVVDRGPYVAGRNWDLTAGACLQLAHCYTGSIQWRLAG